MSYDSLEISVLEGTKGNRELDKKTLATIAANIIIKRIQSLPGKGQAKVIRCADGT